MERLLYAYESIKRSECIQKLRCFTLKHKILIELFVLVLVRVRVSTFDVQ